MYRILALAGKAGSGKDYLLKRTIAAAPDRFHEIVSCTTRPKREGEEEGVNYYYFTPSRFHQAIAADEMLEYTEFNNWYYGTPLSSIEEDKINIGVFNPAGLWRLSINHKVHLSIVYITTDDKTRLMRQLSREENPNIREIIRRFSTDEEDFKHFIDQFPRALMLENSNIEDIDKNIHAIIDWANQTKL